MIIFDRATCRDLATARHREWIETNGIGGYASATIVGLNTRRYHGLLVAATRPPVGRMVMLSKMEETIIIGGHRHDLSTNRYPGAIYPAGYELLKEFRLDPFPTFATKSKALKSRNGFSWFTAITLSSSNMSFAALIAHSATRSALSFAR